VSPETLDLSIASGVLTIRGSREPDASIAEEQYRRRERLHGQWERALALPERVDEEGLSAELKEGILKIRIPKAKQTTSRQIPVVSS
ncbi:MAG: Hsp20/alpha crystallin family protein, partial [Planctomycetaceae bacterium]|nr:Hsp20/alpha crystallin family protein [Planctomycetaceae bacterium]